MTFYIFWSHINRAIKSWYHDQTSGPSGMRIHANYFCTCVVILRHPYHIWNRFLRAFHGSCVNIPDKVVKMATASAISNSVRVGNSPSLIYLLRRLGRSLAKIKSVMHAITDKECPAKSIRNAPRKDLPTLSASYR